MEFAIEIKQLTKVYEGKVNALDGVDLSVKAACIFALLGPNGSGKTTLMRVLTTQFRPTSGIARAFGYDVVSDDANVRKIIGYVPQEMSVWTDITGFENLLIYAKIYGVPSQIRKKNIGDALQSMGLDDVAGKTVKKYSGGMIRRLEIACALLVKPRILFLDEPTLGLDPSARKAVWENLMSFKREYGTTVFFNTHYMDEADQYSDEVAIINKGKIVKSGTASELKHSLHSEIISMSLAGRKAGCALSSSNVDDAIAGRQFELLEKIKALRWVQDASLHDSRLELSVEDGEVALPAIMDALSGEGVAVKRVEMKKPTLDDVFLKYAGMRPQKEMATDKRSSRPIKTN
jgi:ABC-2 type transport system ATP-binding protein